MTTPDTAVLACERCLTRPRPVLDCGPDEPTVDRWVPADTDHTCLGCGDPVRAGDLVAVLATNPPSAVCENCIDY